MNQANTASFPCFQPNKEVLATAKKYAIFKFDEWKEELEKSLLLSQKSVSRTWLDCLHTAGLNFHEALKNSIQRLLL